ncbi:MAG: glycosyltransferase [Bdellovibrionales bacterium]|nr:glycosyltransferase [Bdellovibrionales bacterium]
MLWKLIAASDPRRVRHAVVSLVGKEFIGEEIEKIGVPVHALGLRRGVLPGPGVVRKLLSAVREADPDVVQGWMYHANVAASLARRLTRRKAALAWNIRHSLHDIGHESGLTRLTIRAGARLSGGPHAIIYNAEASARQHEALGYRSETRRIIPNGFDLEQYRPDAQARAAVRAEWGAADSLVVGMIGRFHPMKDHRSFIEAAHIFTRTCPDAVFVFAGQGCTEENTELRALLEQYAPSASFRLLGERRDVPAILAGLDVLTSCSRWGEGFSNILGEACACEVPCVATDVGDSLHIIGDTGKGVPTGNPEALARAWQELHALDADGRSALGARARQRVLEKFSLKAIAETYNSLYEAMVGTLR